MIVFKLISASVQLSIWPVVRDCAYYTFTVLLLIFFIYDGEVTTTESCIMLVFYVGYIIVMQFNIQIRDLVVSRFAFLTRVPDDEMDTLKLKAQSSYYQSFQGKSSPDRFILTLMAWAFSSLSGDDEYLSQVRRLPPSEDPNRTSFYEAANYIIIKHKRLFRPRSRFIAAANLIMVSHEKGDLLIQSRLY